MGSDGTLGSLLHSRSAAGCAATDHVAAGGSEQRGDVTCRDAAIGEAGDGFVTFGTREPDGVSSQGSFDGDLVQPGFAVTPLARALGPIVVVVVDVVPCPRREPATQLSTSARSKRTARPILTEIGPRPFHRQ